eukprot:14338586-Alexandrium_andersonii.AAC.1
MGDAAIQDIEDFRKPEEPGDPERSELSDGPGVSVRGPQYRGDIAGAASPSDLVRAARAEEIKSMESWGSGAFGLSQ